MEPHWLESPWISAVIGLTIWVTGKLLYSYFFEWSDSPSKLDRQVSACQELSCLKAISLAPHQRLSGGLSLLFFGMAAFFAVMASGNNPGTFFWLGMMTVFAVTSLIFLWQALQTYRSLKRVRSKYPNAQIAFNDKVHQGAFAITLEGKTLGIGNHPIEAWAEAARRIEITHNEEMTGAKA